MIKRIFKTLGLSGSIVVQGLIFILAILLILALSYIIGHTYLESNTLLGNDSFSFFSVIDWYSKYFPRVPYWFPNQGAGVSLFAGYPYAPAYFVIILNRLSSLTLVQSFRLLGFLSVPLTGIGIFVFCWTRLTKVTPVFMRQILGIFAALFYVTSPLAWIWLIKWGFYTESISHVFVPWILMFFDLYLDELFFDKKTFARRLYFVLTVIFLVIATWTHIYSGISVLPIFIVLGLYRFISSKEKKAVLFKRLIVPAIALGLSFLCLFYFRYFEFTKYYKFVADGGFGGYKTSTSVEYKEEISRNMLTTRMTLSLDEPIFDTSNPDPTDSFRSTINDLRYPLFVWVLIIPTVVLGIFRSKKMFALGLYVVLGLITSTNPEVVFFFNRLGPLAFLSTILRGRIFFISARVIIPIVSVYGAYVIWDLIGSIISWITDKVKYLKFVVYPIRVIAVLALTLATISVTVYKYYNNPYERTKVNFGTKGPIDLRDIWKKLGVNEKAQLIAPDYIFNNLSGYKIVLEQLEFKNWPIFNVNKDIGSEYINVSRMFDILPDGEYRFDISGYAGRQVMIAPLATNNSMIQIYINTLSLIYNMWNYQTQVMYSQIPLYQKPGVLKEVGKWYGLNYVYLSGSELEPIDYWKTEDSWEQISANWWKFNFNSNLVDITNRPRMLVISDVKKGFYDQTFRFFTRGALPYDEGIPIVGAKEVDSYSLEELQKFDIVFMRGYDYKSKSKAYSLLNDYVKSGGKLIFDTGWQYNIPDWKIEEAPDFMPFNSLSWKNLSINQEFKIENNQIAGNVDASKFGNLSWENTSWGVSVPEILKVWAKPIVSYDSNTLVAAGDYGRGKVVWIGFNIIPHSESKDNLEEVVFFNNLIKYLIGTKEFKSYSTSRQRKNPDEIKIILNEDINEETSLLLKEAYHPYWHAYIYKSTIKEEVPILRAGPGFRLVVLPKLKAGDSVVFIVKKPFLEKFSDLVSIITIIMLMVYLFSTNVIKKLLNFLDLFKRINFLGIVKKISRKGRDRFLGEENDY